MRLVLTFSLGSTFGLGLYLAGMTEPGKVLAFLDITGLWDLSLAFVMRGAISVRLVPFRLASEREESLLGYPVDRPSTLEVDRSLLTGAMYDFRRRMGALSRVPRTGNLQPLPFRPSSAAVLPRYDLRDGAGASPAFLRTLSNVATVVGKDVESQS
jgi:hypothetical protein